MNKEKKLPNPWIILSSMVIAFGLIAISMIVGSENLSNFDISMDNNTKEGLGYLTNLTYNLNQEILDLKKNATDWESRYWNLKRFKESYEGDCMRDVTNSEFCFINGEWIEPCFVSLSYWNDNTTSILIQEMGSNFERE